MLSVSDLTVDFDSVRALNGVSVTVGAGEVLAILGTSGSGKSTLLRSVAGLQPLGAGTVAIDDVDLVGVPPHLRGIGLMFQDGLLFPHLDVAGNVAYGLKAHGIDRAAAAAKVHDLLTLVGLEGFESRSVTNLSGGEQQRVALARSLATEPRVLLLDEPFGALDAVLRERLVADVGGLVRRLGLTVVAVSHDRAEAFALADRVAVMSHGRIVRIGTAEQLWRAPESALVAGLLGMSVVPGLVVGSSLERVGVRPSEVALAAGGTLKGEVEARTLVGDRAKVSVRLADSGALMAVEVPVPQAPVLGDLVGLTLSPDAVVPLQTA